jgi:hypothetical protein
VLILKKYATLNKYLCMSEKFIVEGGLKISSGKHLEIGSSSLSAITTGDTLVATTAAKAFIPSEYSVKTYVDSQLHGPVRIKVGGTDYDINTESEYIGYAGTANEVNVSFAESDAGQTDNEGTLTIGLPDSVDITTDLTVNTMDLATGSITDSTGAISFGNENLSTTGTLAAGATTISGTVSSSGNADFAGTLNVDGTITGNTSLTLDTTTLTTAELGVLDGVTVGTAAASKAMTWAADSTWTANGGTCTDLGSVTTVDINGGSIDGATIATSNVTVGASKTLDVSAGTLTTSAAQKEAILEGLADDADPDLGNNVLTAESYVSDVATGTAPLTVSSTTMVANLNVESLSGMTVIDEDDMATDSATRLPTQQSVKKYVDDQLGTTDMIFAADSNSGTLAGDDLKVDLSGGETFTIAGTSGEIETDTAVANQITIGLPASVDITTDLEVATLDFATGSITDSTGAISFGNENLSTSGTLAAGATTVTGAMSASGAVTGGSIVVGSADMSETDLEKLDGITDGTAAASKALVVDANKDIGTIRNLTIDGVFTDGNYTFDTSGNVSGLGTLGCGAITSTDSSQLAALTVTGATSMEGTVTLGNASSDDLTFTGRSASHLLPNADSSFDLGGSSNHWAKVYTDEIHGDADNMLLFVQDSGSSATEHSFTSEDGVLALQAASHIECIDDVKPNGQAVQSLGSTDNRWLAAHAV